ncbi:MAG: 1-acyl-sn-glycerol-3-phosphate acyltransferase [Bacteroidales bacterium]|nr:1-acyl-sn-glycerol-3-phosphate acyltransferase [Bacteroidales bacterium]
MISFENIDKYDRLYAFYMRYLNIAHNHVYYRHFYVINPENIPPKGEPTIVIANHQNGLMDALAILHTLARDNRQPVFIARGDIYKKSWLAYILRFLKILPTFRTRDGDRSDIRSNLAIYDRAARILKDGGTLVIFPEATHQHGHFMNTFKKGFCRIAFSAEEIHGFSLGLKVLPLNIHYSNYFNFQSDLMVTVGEPFTFEELFDLYKEHPNDAYLALNDKARARVKALTPDIDIPEYYNEIEALTHIMSEPLLRHKKLKVNYLPNQKDAAMTIIARLKQYREEQEPAFNNLMEETREYVSLLTKRGLHHWVINKKLSTFRLVGRILLMILSLPIFFFGYINNFIPTFITQRITSKVKDPMFHSSVQYSLGSIAIFPLYYILLLTVVWLISKHFWIAIAYVFLSAITAFFVHYYKIALRKFYTVFHAMRLRQTADYRTLSSLNKIITGTMEGLLF